MQNINNIQKADVVFLDPGLYASEDFTSGLLIVLENILKRLKNKGLNVAILSLVNKRKSIFFKNQKEGLYLAKNSDFSSYQYLLETDIEECNNNKLREILIKLLSKVESKLILMPVPAVFLSSNDILMREIANLYSKKVVHLLVDHLFPKYSDKDILKDLTYKLYKEIKQGSVIAVTKQIANLFEEETGIQSEIFNNPFILGDIIIDSNNHEERYITMVNTHPIKGVALFDRIARKMPELNFMIFKNWVDVPDYIPPNNVIVRDFVKKPKDIYKHSKILLIPSLIDEGPTRVIIEALVNKIPVIASNIGSLPEFGKGNCILIDPPKINGYQYKGSIIYPIIEDSDLEYTAEQYCKNITNLLSSSDFFLKWTEEPSNNALSYVKTADLMLDKIIQYWIREMVLSQ